MLSITREVMAVATRHTQPVGQLLRQWREERRLSQLELSSRSGVSTRHLSFVETGRSQPSREMVLRLADQLDVPLRDRNQLLLTAGYAPVYAQTPLESPHMSPVRAAIAQVLSGHEPYPAVVVDREWNLVDANGAAAVFIDRDRRAPAGATVQCAAGEPASRRAGPADRQPGGVAGAPAGEVAPPDPALPRAKSWPSCTTS